MIKKLSPFIFTLLALSLLLTWVFVTEAVQAAPGSGPKVVRPAPNQQAITQTTQITEAVGTDVGGPNIEEYEALIPDPLPPRTDLPIWVNLGDPITYTFKITNVGPVQATDVYFADPLPPEVSLQTATASRGSCSPGAEIICDLGNLAPGMTATITIVVTPTTTGLISNTGRVGSKEIDPAKAKTYRTKLYVVVPAAAAQPAPGIDPPTETIDSGDRLKIYLPVVVKVEDQ